VSIFKSFRSAAYVLCVCLAVSAAGTTLAARDTTVGEFVQQLAKARNLEAGDAGLAVESLASVGIRIPTDLPYTKQLTEGDVARIGRAAGLAVRTSNPDAPFTGEQVDIFLLGFGDQLGTQPGEGENSTRNGETPGGQSGGAPGNGPPFDPYAKGKGGSKGKKKGHRSYAEPE